MNAPIDRSAFDEIAAALGTAWNAADGAAFARPFTDHADFVNIYAMHGRGREAIAQGHQGIFYSIYAAARTRSPSHRCARSPRTSSCCT